MITSTRSVLKKKVREVVDKVGPKLFKNFEKLRVVVFDKDKRGGSENLGSSRRIREGSPRKSEKTETNYDLDYKEELELNLAFEIFKDILD